MAVEQYREWIQQLLSARAARGVSQPYIETQAVLPSKAGFDYAQPSGWWNIIVEPIS